MDAPVFIFEQQGGARGWLKTTDSAVVASKTGSLASKARQQVIQHCPSPNFSSRENSVVDVLVIHNISLPPGCYGGGYVQQFFRNCLPTDDHPYFQEIADIQVSAHFLIERDGALTQFVSICDKAWHAGQSCFNGRDNCNDFSIGIELEGMDDEVYTDIQYLVLSELSKSIQKFYPAISVDNIVGHSDIAPQRKTDPGAAFDWERYRQLLC